MKKPILVRITTVPVSLNVLLSGQMRFMTENGFQVYMVSSGLGTLDEVEEIQKRENSEFVKINMTRTISPVADLISLYKLIKLLRKLKPQIVHTHTPKSGLLGMLASKFCNVPIRLHTVAGLPLVETSGIKRKILKHVESITYWCASKVYPNSLGLKNIIIENKFCSPSKMTVIGNGSSNGINSEFFNLTEDVNQQAQQLREKLALTNNYFIFLFIGRIVREKGINELIEAYTALKEKYKSRLRLLLVGPFERDLDPLSQTSEKLLKSDKSIIQIDFQKDVRPYYAISNVVVLPSYREGFPNVPMQAGCFNLPSIVSDINGCNEIIQNEKNGLIIPKKDTLALRKAMERLLVDKELYQKIQLNARELIMSRYEQKFIWKLLLQEYQQQLKQKVQHQQS